MNGRQNTILVEGMLINGSTHSISRTFATGRIQVKCHSACKCLSKHTIKMVHVAFPCVSFDMQLVIDSLWFRMRQNEIGEGLCLQSSVTLFLYN